MLGAAAHCGGRRSPSAVRNLGNTLASGPCFGVLRAPMNVCLTVSQGPRWLPLPPEWCLLFLSVCGFGGTSELQPLPPPQLQLLPRTSVSEPRPPGMQSPPVLPAPTPLALCPLPPQTSRMSPVSEALVPKQGPCASVWSTSSPAWSSLLAQSRVCPFGETGGL